jgi:hypothetical protein
VPNKAQYNEYETECINGNVTIAPIQHSKYPEIEIKNLKLLLLIQVRSYHL